MTVTYTFDVFSSLDSRASVTEDADWCCSWGKQGPELLEERLGEYSGDQRLVLGANTYRAFAAMVASAGEGDDVFDPWVTEMRNLPTTVISNTLEEPLD
ncbi:deaminase, partial [Burkholderia multivorans]